MGQNQKFDNGGQAPNRIPEDNLTSAWKTPLEAAVCEHCDWSYLRPKDSLLQHCPHCFRSGLTPLSEGLEGLAYTHPPESLLPFMLASETVAGSIQNFAKGIPFAPSDLKPDNLWKRLRRLYLPMWLVDADVEAIWQAEAGYDYEVVSHQDRYDENRGGWSSHQVKEGRIRWEQRLGKLKRSYQNVVAPALEEQERMERSLGKFDLAEASAYQPQALENAFVRLPNRAPEDAWGDAKSAFQAAAAEECRQAASADHIRQFSWKSEYSSQNWTLLLQPLYSTYYLDDDGNPQAVLVQGQTGNISGSRRASMKQGRRAALIILGIAALIFVLSLILSAASALMPVLLALGVLGLAIALLVGASAVLPIATVWWFNRRSQI